MAVPVAAIIGAGLAMSSAAGKKKGSVAQKILDPLGIFSDTQLEDQMALNQQAAQLNYQYGEQAAENAYKRQLAMYERSYHDQSYGAMRKQMEDAGLSVGLMYGGSGSGGGQGEMSGAPQGDTGGATAGTAPTREMRLQTAMQLSQLALTMQNMKADVKVKETTAEKNEADAETARANAEAARANAGLQTERKITEMQSRGRILQKLDAEIHEFETRSDLQEAQKHLTEVDARIGEIKENIMRLTEQDQISKIHWEAQKMYKDYQLAIQEIWGSKMDNWLKEKTYNIVRKQYEYELKTMGAKYVQEYWKAYVDQEKVEIFEQYGAEKAYQEVYGMYLDNQLKGPQAIVDMWYKQHELELKKLGLGLEERKMFVNALSSALGTLGAGLLFGRGMQK